jgi:tRNA(Ile)-lysidine synthase
VHQLELERRPGESLEAHAREARYRAFAEMLAEGDAVATAHHLDDQAETLLLALLRGSGVNGLAAMPARAALGRGHLLRPLLGVERDALRAYAEEHRLQWLDDPANAVLAFDRNRLRHQILPLLRERWPAASSTIARSATHCAEAAALLDATADDALPGLQGSRPESLSVSKLAGLEPARARLVLRRWLKAGGFRVPSSVCLNRILTEVLHARRDAAPMLAWEGCEVRRYRDDLFALAPLPGAPSRDLAWSTDSVLELPAGLGRLEWVAGVRPRPVSLTVNFAQPGQHCLQPGRPRRPLNKLFQEEGVPSWLRPLVPRLVGTDGSLLLVPGVCACGLPAGSVRWLGHPWQSLGWFDQ